jgi:hypothetical protein
VPPRVRRELRPAANRPEQGPDNKEEFALSPAPASAAGYRIGDPGGERVDLRLTPNAGSVTTVVEEEPAPFGPPQSVMASSVARLPQRQFLLATVSWSRSEPVLGGTVPRDQIRRSFIYSANRRCQKAKIAGTVTTCIVQVIRGATRSLPRSGRRCRRALMFGLSGRSWIATKSTSRTRATSNGHPPCWPVERNPDRCPHDPAGPVKRRLALRLRRFRTSGSDSSRLVRPGEGRSAPEFAVRLRAPTRQRPVRRS